jgi:FKBP-type peptidyl-prolyl cis-trans isomerase
MSFLSNLLLFISICICNAFSLAKDVKVEVQSPGNGPAVTRGTKYSSHVTLYIQNADGTKTPSGWSTRQSDGAPEDQPFPFSPGVGLIEGWTEGVLQMKEGERSWLFVPSEKGYGARELGTPGGPGFYIPANSDLAFDIEILGKDGGGEL